MPQSTGFARTFDRGYPSTAHCPYNSPRLPSCWARSIHCLGKNIRAVRPEGLRDMTQPLKIDRDKTAVVIMDFQERIIANNASDPENVVKQASAVLQGARAAGIPVIYVVHRGGPFAAYAPDVELHEGVPPADGEMVITKVRPGPFSTTNLDVTLRELGRDTLVIMGVSTSGCVLSCTRWAVDVNYKFIVVSDACSDGDPEVHRVLTEKVYPRMGTVVNAQEFLNAI